MKTSKSLTFNINAPSSVWRKQKKNCPSHNFASFPNPLNGIQHIFMWVMSAKEMWKSEKDITKPIWPHASNNNSA